jgi:hypothetical protein
MEQPQEVLVDAEVVFMKLPDSDAPLEVLNNVTKAAHKLGEVSPYSVWAWLRDGKLERTKVGAPDDDYRPRHPRICREVKPELTDASRLPDRPVG